MGGAEGVVDVEVGELGQLAAESGVVFFLAGVEPHVFQEQTSPSAMACRPLSPPSGPMQSGAMVTGRPRRRVRCRGDGRQAVFGIRFPLGPAEMGGKDQPAALFEDMADGRQGGDDPGVVGNGAAFHREGH